MDPVPKEFEFLSTRARNALLRAGFRSLQAVFDRSDESLSGIRNFGWSSLNEVRSLQAEVENGHIDLSSPQLTNPRSDTQKHGASAGFADIESELRQAFASEERAAQSPPANLAEELLGLFRKIDDRSRLVFEARNDPLRPLSLQETAAIAGGFTRERARQIQKRTTQKLTGAAAVADVTRLRTAVAALQAESDRLVIGEAAAFLSQRGHVLTAAEVRTLLAVWVSGILGLKMPDKVRRNARHGHSIEDLELMELIDVPAKRASRNSGSVRAASLATEINVDENKCEEILLALGYSDVGDGWFRSPVTNKDVFDSVTRKVLAVSPTVTARELRASLTKHLFRSGFPAPPTTVVMRIAALLGYSVDESQRISSPNRFEIIQELNGSELAIVERILSCGGVANFGELFTGILESGFRPITLAVRLKQSPVIRKLGHGVYSLVGHHYSAADVQAAKGRVVDIEPSPEIVYRTDGTISYSLNLGAWFFYGGVIPSGGLAPFAGVWHATKGRRVKINEQFVWGLSKLLDGHRLNLGDRITLTLNTFDRSISFTAGASP